MYESKIYKTLENNEGIPHILWSGIEGDFSAMVMDMLGPSLEDLFKYCRRKFTIKTTVMIADQMLQRIDLMHQNQYIHRDIKPDNFLLGTGKRQGIIYVIDFGLAKRYKDPKTGQHNKFKNDKSLTGTARYASLNSHLGFEQSRRDDIESIGHIMIYFMKGILPWQGLKNTKNEPKLEQIKNLKKNTPLKTLCEGCPPQIELYMNYARSLGFDQDPDVDMLRNKLRGILT